jgi:hypothetical protein
VYRSIQLERKNQIKACAKACGLGSFQWDDMVDVIKERPEFQLPTEQAYTTRMEQVLMEEYSIKNPDDTAPQSRRRTRSIQGR